MFIVNCFRSCCKTRTFDPDDLAFGEKVVQEVNKMAVSSHDIISRVAIDRIPDDQHEAGYEEFGPSYLEYMEYLEKLHAVRTMRGQVSDRGLPAPATARYIATTLFGVGECQEKAELTALKVAAANRRFLTISCEGERDGHEFVLLGVTLERFQELCPLYDWELLDILPACKTGVVVDAYFGWSHPASRILERRDFVAFMHVFGIKRIQTILPFKKDCPTERIWQDARKVYEQTKRSILRRRDTAYDPEALDFMRKSRADIVEKMKQRHSSSPSVLEQIHTGSTVSELIRLEIREAAQAYFPKRVLKCIAGYVVSPFKGLKMG